MTTSTDPDDAVVPGRNVAPPTATLTHGNVIVLRESTVEGQFRETALPAGEYRLGRGEEVEYLLLAPDVSRVHARLVVTPTRVTIRDLGSKNGVLIDGQRVEGEHVLGDGAIFEIGASRLEVRWYSTLLNQVVAASGEPTLTRVGPATVQRGLARSLPSATVPLVVGAVLLLVAAILVLNQL